MGGIQSVPGSPNLLPGPNIGGLFNQGFGSQLPNQLGRPLPAQLPAVGNQLPAKIANQNFGGNFIPGFTNPALIPFGLWQGMGATQLPAGQTFVNPASSINFDNLFKNAANLGLNPSYLKWKRDSDLGDYLDAHKYFSWKQAARGNLKDWDKYEDWKNKVWTNIEPKTFTNDFNNWKGKIDKEDAQKWKEWNEWKKIKDESNKKNLRKRNRDYEKNKRAYQHFVKRADLKAYGKFVKFQDWLNWARDQQVDIDNMDAYYIWSDNYIYNVPLVRRQYEKWRNDPNPSDFQLWVKWMKWDKMRNEAQTLEDQEGETTMEKRGKEYGKKYRQWYKNEYPEY